jgi:hypothetical protein
LIQFNRFELNIIETSSVDILLHSRGETNIPLVAVEFDGPYHDTIEQQKKDRTKECVLKKVGIPLVRVRFDEVDFGKQIDKMNRIARLAYREYSILIKDFVETLSLNRLALDACETPIRNFVVELQKSEDLLAQALFGKSFIDLSVQQQKDISIQLSITRKGQTLQELEFERAEVVSHIEFDVRSSTESLLKEELKASKPEFFGDFVGGRSARIVCAFEGHEPREIESPKIRLISNFSSDNVEYLALDSCLVRYLAAKAQSIWRTLQPAVRNT